MTARTRRLLAAVARLYPCAVISGRARGDLQKRLRHVPLLALTGSHGAENDGSARNTPRSRVAFWVRHLRWRLRGLRGVALEVKPHGVAVHYRQALDKRAVRAAILSTVKGLENTRHIRGKDVVEVLPAGRADQGRRAGGAPPSARAAGHPLHRRRRHGRRCLFVRRAGWTPNRPRRAWRRDCGPVPVGRAGRS